MSGHENNGAVHYGDRVVTIREQIAELERDVRMLTRAVVAIGILLGANLLLPPEALQIVLQGLWNIIAP